MRTVMPFTVRYAETDMMGVVHHANYLLYLEDARTGPLPAGGASVRPARPRFPRASLPDMMVPAPPTADERQP